MRLLLLLSFFHLCCGRAGSSFPRPGSLWQGISFSSCHVQAPRWQDAFIACSLNISCALSSEGEGRVLPAPEDSLEGSVRSLLCWGIRDIWDTPAPGLGWVHPPSPLTQHQYRLWLGWALRAGVGSGWAEGARVTSVQGPLLPRGLQASCPGTCCGSLLPTGQRLSPLV